jgi:GxxExxY protein
MELSENEIAKEVVDAAFKIHQRLGPGLLESVYEAILAYELRKRGLEVHRQMAVPIVWDDLRFEEGFRADLYVEDKVIVELKSQEQVIPVHKKQLLTHIQARRQTTRAAYQFQRRINQEWNLSSRERSRGVNCSASKTTFLCDSLCAFASLRE